MGQTKIHIHSYKISERKKQNKNKISRQSIITCTLVVLKFRLYIYPLLNETECTLFYKCRKKYAKDIRDISGGRMNHIYCFII